MPTFNLMMSYKHAISLFLVAISFIGCQSNKESTPPIAITPPIDLPAPPSIPSDTNFYLPSSADSVALTILYPSTPVRAALLALPGWNFPKEQWCDSTSLCQQALKNGYAVILPEMGKSIYASTTFPETRKDWLRYPTRSWMDSVLFPRLQADFNLLLPTAKNAVIGLSTGARGAVLLALDHPQIFDVCIALSGDYDQTRYPKDNLYRGFYGNYSQHTERWTLIDNVITSIQDYSVPTYIGHGKNDRVVPLAHSQQLASALEKRGVPMEFHIDSTAGHNYTYWDSELPAVFQFLEFYFFFTAFIRLEAPLRY